MKKSLKVIYKCLKKTSDRYIKGYILVATNILIRDMNFSYIFLSISLHKQSNIILMNVFIWLKKTLHLMILISCKLQKLSVFIKLPMCLVSYIK